MNIAILTAILQYWGGGDRTPDLTVIVNFPRLRVNDTLPSLIFVLSYHVSGGKLVPEFCAEVRTSLGDSSAPPLRNFAPRLNIHALPPDKSHTII